MCALVENLNKDQCMKSLLIAVYEILSAITEDLRSVEWLAYNKLPESLKDAIEVLMKELEDYLDVEPKTNIDTIIKDVRKLYAENVEKGQLEVNRVINCIRHMRNTYLDAKDIKDIHDSVDIPYDSSNTIARLAACKKFVEKFIL